MTDDEGEWKSEIKLGGEIIFCRLFIICVFTLH